MERAYEDSEEVAGDFTTLADDALIEAWRDLTTRWPLLEFSKDPPGAFNTVDDITTTTITVAAAGESVAATLSVAPAVSIAGRKIQPSGKDYYLRVTAHVAGATAITVDAAPETLTAGTKTVIYQDEYDLATDIGMFQDGLWYPNGRFVELKPVEVLNREFAPPQGDATPAVFARIGKRKIRLSDYPTAVDRVEYPYIAEPADPSGSTTLVLPAHWRAAFAESALAILLGMKFDRREDRVETRAERLIERAIQYERRRLHGLQTHAPVRYAPAYGS